MKAVKLVPTSLCLEIVTPSLRRIEVSVYCFTSFFYPCFFPFPGELPSPKKFGGFFLVWFFFLILLLLCEEPAVVGTAHAQFSMWEWKSAAWMCRDHCTLFTQPADGIEAPETSARRRSLGP